MFTHHLAVSAMGLSRHFRDSLKIAHSLGVDGVEVDGRYGLSPEELSSSGLRQIRKWLDDFGLRVSAVSFPTRRGYGDADALEAFRHDAPLRDALGAPFCSAFEALVAQRSDD